MAPTFKARSPRVWAQQYRLTRYADSVDWQRQVDTYETTVIEDNDKNYIPGLRFGLLKCDGIANGYTTGTASTHSTAALDGATKRPAWQEGLSRALGSTTPQIWTAAMSGDAINANAYLVLANGTDLSYSAPCAGRVGVSAQTQPSQKPNMGRMHLPGTSIISSTGAQTAVDYGIAAGSPNGAVVHYHLTDVTTAAGSTVATLKIVMQQSSNGGAWADIPGTSSTFAGPGQAWKGVGRMVIAGTIKRQTRALVKTYTGGASKRISVAVALARSSQ